MTDARLPFLKLLYHLEADMSPDEFHVGAPFAAGQRRVVLNIVGGVVDGPAVKGRIEHLGGADWGVMVDGTDVSCAAIPSRQAIH